MQGPWAAEWLPGGARKGQCGKGKQEKLRIQEVGDEAGKQSRAKPSSLTVLVKNFGLLSKRREKPLKGNSMISDGQEIE